MAEDPRVPQDGKINAPDALVSAVQRHLNKHGAKLKIDGLGIAQDGRTYLTIQGPPEVPRRTRGREALEGRLGLRACAAEATQHRQVLIQEG